MEPLLFLHPMSDFVVSARKYRPATFDTVVGQGSITSTLKNAIKSHHLAQAFLFCGPRGVGKTTCARILAKTINCQSVTTAVEACDKCDSCKSFNSGQSLNIYELDAASNNSVDDIRSLIDQVRFAPQLGDYKVYIIDEVHMLSAQAFNAFLKTLEEPPKHAIFILATTEKHKIIPTILSRCQIFDFSRITIDDIAKHLAFVALGEKVEAEPDALDVIAQKADGALRDALSIFDQIVSFAGNKVTYEDVIRNLNILDHDHYFNVMDQMLKGNIPAALLGYDQILQKGFDGHHFLAGLSAHCRNLMVCKDTSTAQLLEAGANVREKYLDQSKRTPLPFIMKALDTLTKADIGYKAARNPRLLVELALMQLCSVNNVEVAAAEKKNDSPELSDSSSSGNSTKTTETVAPVAQNKFKSISTPSANSISSLLNKKAEETKKQQDDLALPEMREPVTQAQLDASWLVYTELLRKANKINLATTLLNRKPLLQHDHNIEFTIDNKVQEEELLQDKSSLMLHLRRSLRNSYLQLVVIITRDESEKKPYTPSEKFRKMAQKNPALNKLKQEFDLDIEY